MAAATVSRATRFAAAFPLLLALLVALTGTVPLLWNGPSCGHDFDFHLQSWLAVRAAWHAHIFAPAWVAAANYGAGEPRFIFYPPFSWLLGGLLGTILSIGLPSAQAWSLAPIAFTFVAIAGATASMYGLARRYAPAGAAAVAATIYGLSPYLLFNAYERTAYAELLAAAWFPLLLGELLRAVATPYSQLHLQLRQIRIERVALLLAALWYTNAPAGVMGCYLVLFTMLFVALQRTVEVLHNNTQDKRWAHWVASLAGSVVLGCTLSADYLFPAWYQQRSVAIARAVGPGMQVQDSFLFGRAGEPFHDQVLRTASWVVVATLAVAVLSGAAILRRRGQALRGKDGDGAVARDNARITAFLAAVLLMCFLLQLPWSISLWRLLPQMAFLQFPWRLLLPMTAAAALLTSIALREAFRAAPGLFDERSRSARVAAIALFLVVYTGGVVWWTAKTRYQPCDDEDRVAAQLTLLSSGLGFEGTDEYAPKETDNGEIQQGLPFVRLMPSSNADEGDDSAAANPAWQPSPALLSGSVAIARLTPEAFAVRVRPATQVGNQPVYAVLRLERSPDWEIAVNGQPCGAACDGLASPREDGLLTIRIPADAATLLTGHVRSGFDAPWDVWFGRGLTLASACLLLMLRGWPGRRGWR